MKRIWQDSIPYIENYKECLPIEEAAVAYKK